MLGNSDLIAFVATTDAQHCIFTFPNGDRVSWFHDPDGNTLSITQIA